MALKAINFDITNTILTVKYPVGLYYAKIGALYDVHAIPDDLSKHFKLVFKKLSKEYSNFGQKNIGWQEWWEKLVFGTFENALPGKSLPKNTMHQISQRLLNDYKTAECWTLADGTEDLLKKLNSKNLKLGVISNYDPRLIDILRNFQLHTYFQFVITSYEAKCEKPSQQIFQLVEDTMQGIKKKEILHVGDNPKLDFQGAKNAGWNALLVSKSKEEIMVNYPTIKTECIVRDITEIYPNLESKGYF